MKTILSFLVRAATAVVATMMVITMLIVAVFVVAGVACVGVLAAVFHRLETHADYPEFVYYAEA